MKVHLTRTGGIAGATLEAQLDSAQLAPPLAQELDVLVARADFSPPSPPPVPANPSPTAFRYALTVEHHGANLRIEVDQEVLAPPMADLVEFVLKVARGKGQLRTRRA